MKRSILSLGLLISCVGSTCVATRARYTKKARNTAETVAPKKNVRHIEAPEYATKDQPKSAAPAPAPAPTHAAHHQEQPARKASRGHDVIEPTSEDMVKRGQVQAHEVKAALKDVCTIDDHAAQDIAQHMNTCHRVCSTPPKTEAEIANKGQEITDAMNTSRDSIKKHVSKGDAAHWEEHKDTVWKNLYPTMQ